MLERIVPPLLSQETNRLSRKCPGSDVSVESRSGALIDAAMVGESSKDRSVTALSLTIPLAVEIRRNLGEWRKEQTPRSHEVE